MTAVGAAAEQELLGYWSWRTGLILATRVSEVWRTRKLAASLTAAAYSWHFGWLSVGWQPAKREERKEIGDKDEWA